MGVWKHFTHLERLFIHSNLALEASQIEIILDELFRHLGEVFVAQEGAERGNPRLGRA